MTGLENFYRKARFTIKAKKIDMHALQGDGEIAGHTCDVSGTVTLKVQVLKKVNLEGPVLLLRPDDLPYLARPLSAEEKQKVMSLARRYGLKEISN